MNTFANKYTPVLWQDIIVAGASSPLFDGVYTLTGYSNGFPVWTAPSINLPLSGGGVGPIERAIGNSGSGTWALLGPCPDGDEYFQGAGYVSTGPWPWTQTWDPNELPPTTPTVTQATQVQPQGLLTLTDLVQTLDDLGIRPDTLGPATAILLSAVPADMAANAPTAFLYSFGNFSGDPWGPTGFGYLHTSTNGTDKGYALPLLIEGRAAIDSLKLAGPPPGLQLYYQLLQGGV